MGLFVMQPRLLILCLRKIGETEPRGGGLGLLSPSRARTETIPLNRAPRNCAVCHRSERRGQPWGRQAQIRHFGRKARGRAARALGAVAAPNLSLFTHPACGVLQRAFCVRSNCPRPNIPRRRVVVPAMREAALRTLRLSRGADDAAVRAAYRRLAKEYHPDVSGGSGEAFKRISEAAEFLLGDGSAAAARDTRAAETVGPAIRARWNIRRRHQPSEYPAWFKPSTPEPNSRGLHTFVPRPFVSLVPRDLLSGLQWPCAQECERTSRGTRPTCQRSDGTGT